MANKDKSENDKTSNDEKGDSTDKDKESRPPSHYEQEGVEDWCDIPSHVHKL